jgi:hypothetical protein
VLLAGVLTGTAAGVASAADPVARAEVASVQGGITVSSELRQIGTQLPTGGPKHEFIEW